MQIIAGIHRGAKLTAPPSSTTRPTGARVREALFSLLNSRLGGLDGVRVLDLFCGSGALAFEALSRGAAAAVLVEKDRRAANIARQNARRLGEVHRCDVRVQPVARALDALARSALGTSSKDLKCDTQEPEINKSLGPTAGLFDLVFADPPYEGDGLAQVFQRIGGPGLLSQQGLLVTEFAKRTPPDPELADVAGLRLTDNRVYGDTGIAVYCK